MDVLTVKLIKDTFAVILYYNPLNVSDVCIIVKNVLKGFYV